MSGGHWQYQSHRIRELPEMTTAFIEAIADSEHIIDWSESCDTFREEAEKELYDLWLKTFNKVFASYI